MFRLAWAVMNRSDQLAALGGRAFNYAEVGATTGTLPSGYEHTVRRRVIGRGSGVFAEASAALLGWEMHKRAGLSVVSATADATSGEDVLLGIGVGPLRLAIPCRVVYVVDETNRRGFAYGTLAGHPESGEELFVVARDQDEGVSVEITAFSRPALWWSRLGGPVTRRLQTAVTTRYLTALT